MTNEATWFVEFETGATLEIPDYMMPPLPPVKGRSHWYDGYLSAVKIPKREDQQP